MREPGDEQDDEVGPVESMPQAAPATFVERGQALIRRIVASQDSNEKQMLHRELTELLMRKR